MKTVCCGTAAILTQTRPAVWSRGQRTAIDVAMIIRFTPFVPILVANDAVCQH
jgi:hypothetical protein